MLDTHPDLKNFHSEPVIAQNYRERLNFRCICFWSVVESQSLFIDGNAQKYTKLIWSMSFLQMKISGGDPGITMSFDLNAIEYMRDTPERPFASLTLPPPSIL